MRFVDEAEIIVKSGKGGNGCVSFRRERRVPRGGPDGGDGGWGGDIVLRAASSMLTLLDFKYRRFFKAKKGGHGSSNQKCGKNAPPLVILVPAGTGVFDPHTGRMLADLVEDGQEFTAAKGGRGGRGNLRFVSSTNRAPRSAEEGENGIEKKLKLILRVIADVGIIGLPNVGKSTLLATLTDATPKIAPYPFTTLKPKLGAIISDDYWSFTIADLPGLIEGASGGKGLGHRFLKHVERATLLLHLLSMEEGIEPEKNYCLLKEELEKFNPELLEKEEVVVLNKIDLPPIKKVIQRVHRYFQKLDKPFFAISALRSEGIEPLVKFLSARITQIKKK